MIKARKLQYIGGQYLMNIPRSFVKRSSWDKGDYFDITYMDKNTLQVSKIAHKESSRPMALMPREQQAASSLFNMLLEKGWELGPIDFASCLNDISSLLAKIRKHQIMILMPPTPMPRKIIRK